MILLALCARLALADEPTLRLQVQLGHTFSINSVAFSPDGELAISAGNDQTVRVWDLASGHLLGLIPTGEDPVTAFDADGLLVVADRGLTRRFDLRTLDEVSRVDAGTSAVALSADGSTFALAQGDPDSRELDAMGNWGCDLVRVADVATGATADEAVMAGEDGFCLRWIELAVGATVVAATDTTITRVRPIGSGIGSGYDLKGASVLALSGDERRLIAMTGGQGLVQPDLTVYDVATGKRLRRIRKADPDATDNIAVDATGSRALVANDATLRWFDLTTGKELGQWAVGPRKVALSPDGTRALLGHRDDGDVDVFDLATGTIVRTFAGRAPAIASVAFLGPRVALGGTDGTVAVWSLETLSLERTLDVNTLPVIDLEASSDGRTLLVAINDPHNDGGYTSTLWDVITGESLAELADEKATSGAFLAGGRVVTVFRDSVATISSLPFGEKVGELAMPQGVRVLGSSADGATLAVCGVGELSTRSADALDTPLWSVPLQSFVCTELDVTDDASLIAVAGCGSRDDEYGILDAMSTYGSAGDCAVEVWRPGEDSPEATFTFEDDPAIGIIGVAIAHDGSRVVATRDDGVVRAWDLTTYDELGTLHQAGSVAAADIAPDGLIATAGLVDAARLWRLETGLDVQLASDARDNWVMFASNGWFDASRNGGDLVAVIGGTEAFGVEQFATQTNRPDLLATGLGAGSPELAAHWEARYERRLRKLGVAAHALAGADDVPRVAMTGTTQDGRSLALTFDVTAAREDLVRYDVYVNGVPVYAGGRPLTGRAASVTETVALGDGDNTVEVAVIDAAGVESPRAIVAAKVDGAVRGDLWFLGFGVSDYADPALPDLALADDDATALGARFAAMSDAYDDVHVKVLTDADVTAAALTDARAFVADAAIDDTLVVFVAGHGLHDTDPAATYYFLPHDTVLDRLADTAASFDRVEALLQGVAPRKKLLLLDTCESGEAEDAPPQLALAEGARGVPRGVWAANHLGAAPRPWLYDRERYIYNDLSRRTGAIVFSASRGGEYSFESAEIGHGFFTYELLQGLAGAADSDGDHVVGMEELRSFVARAVAERSEGDQHPVVDRDNLAVKFGFPTTP